MQTLATQSNQIENAQLKEIKHLIYTEGCF